jgi:hypothetical protein
LDRHNEIYETLDVIRAARREPHFPVNISL